MDVPDSDLFGREVVHRSGARMGRIDAIVHRDGACRIAVVRRGRALRRWYCVALEGAELVDGRVLACAPFGRPHP